jgi:hypothetical protein
MRRLATTIAAHPVTSRDDSIHIRPGEMLTWKGEMRDWRRVLVDWRGESYIISRAAWNTAMPHTNGAQVSAHAHLLNSDEKDYSAAATAARLGDSRRHKLIGAKAVEHDESSSQSVRDLMTAMERGDLSMQEVAEALTATEDDELRMFGALLGERQRAAMVPRATGLRALGLAASQPESRA